MIALKDAGGQVFRAHTAIGIVRQMRESAWVAPGKQEYMREVADRIKVLDAGKSDVNTTSPDAFLDSLVRFGWLKPVQAKEK